jgi:hypothetical protein
MSIESGIYRILQVADGAYTCRILPIPRDWNPIERPHVALIMPSGKKIIRFYLSHPSSSSSGEQLNVASLDQLPPNSIIEVRYGSTDYRYYRHDETMWSMIAESQNQLFLDVFTQPETYFMFLFDD